MSVNITFEFADKMGFTSPFASQSGNNARPRKWADESDFFISSNKIVDFIIKNYDQQVIFDYLSFNKRGISNFIGRMNPYVDSKNGKLDLEFYVNEGNDMIDFCRDPFFSIEYNGLTRAFNFCLSWEYATVKGREPSQRFAILVISQNFTHFSYLLDKLNKKLTDYAENMIAEAFISKMKTFENDIAALNTLYSQMPSFVAKKLGDDRLWRDMIKLLMYGIKGMLSFSGNKSSAAILNLLRGFSDMKFLYQSFLASPRLVKTLYGTMKNSSVIEGVEMSNRTIFTSLLTAICYLNYGELKYTGQTFYVGKEYKPDSNLIRSNDKDDEKIFLAQLELIEYEFSDTPVQVTGLAGPGATDHYTDGDISFVPVDNGGYYGPLDMVMFVYKDTGQSVMVQAIFVKDVADQLEWNEIMKKVRIGVDILVIALSIPTLLSGPGAFMLVLSSIDFAMASTDIVITGIQEELSKTPDGKKFLEIWGTINTAVAVASLPVLIRDVFALGARLLTSVSSDAKNLITAMLTKIILDKHIARFAESTLRALEPEVVQIGISITNIRNLYSAGLIFASSQVESERIIVAIYKGASIAEGTEKEVNALLKDVIGLEGNKLINALEEIWKLIPKLDETEKYFTCFNKAGSELKWENQQWLNGILRNEDAITGYITSLKNSKRADNLWVAKVSEEFNKIDPLTSINNKVQNVSINVNAGDIDVAGKVFFIECKQSLRYNSINSDFKKQFDKYLLPKDLKYNANFINVENKKVILAIEELENIKILNHPILKELESRGLKIITNLNQIKSLKP